MSVKRRQGQPVDGQVAVEMISAFRISGTRIKAVQTNPNASITHGQRGGRNGTEDGWSGGLMHYRHGSDEDVGNGIGARSSKVSTAACHRLELRDRAVLLLGQVVAAVLDPDMVPGKHLLDRPSRWL